MAYSNTYAEGPEASVSSRPASPAHKSTGAYVQGTTVGSGVKNKRELRRDGGFYLAAFPVVNALAQTKVEFSASSNALLTREDVQGINALIIARNFDPKPGEGFLLSFFDSMWLCIAINSASVQQPGRATFWVGGTAFNLRDTFLQVVGESARRYNRAVAAEIRRVVCVVLGREPGGKVAPYATPWSESDDERKRDTHAAVMYAAESRGLSRYPYLVADGSEALTDLSPVERHAVWAAKDSALADVMGVNAVDNPLAGSTAGNASGVRASAVRNSLPAGSAGSDL